jgi:hypothetical protein
VAEEHALTSKKRTASDLWDSEEAGWELQHTVISTANLLGRRYARRDNQRLDVFSYISSERELGRPCFAFAAAMIEEQLHQLKRANPNRGRNPQTTSHRRTVTSMKTP